MLALRDPLTELHNRRFMNDRLPAEVARAARTRNELAIPIAIVDLDEFKPINDSLGHASGDRALRAFGRALSTGLAATIWSVAHQLHARHRHRLRREPPLGLRPLVQCSADHLVGE